MKKIAALNSTVLPTVSTESKNFKKPGEILEITKYGTGTVKRMSFNILDHVIRGVFLTCYYSCWVLSFLTDIEQLVLNFKKYRETQEK